MGSVNQYIKTIYLLVQENKEASTLNIAKKLGIKSASVTEMLKKLASDGSVNYSPYHGVTLTKRGEEIAKKLIRKHLLLEAFLKNILKLSDEEVCKQASALEDSLTDHADQQLCIFLKRPTEGPIEKEAIPHCTKKISCEECLATGNKLQISRTSADSSKSNILE